MFYLYLSGKTLWRIPLDRNITMVQGIKRLLKHEIRCKILLGEQLKRDQLTFLKKVLDRIYASPARTPLSKINNPDPKAKDETDEESTEHDERRGHFGKGQELFCVVIQCRYNNWWWRRWRGILP